MEHIDYVRSLIVYGAPRRVKEWWIDFEESIGKAAADHLLEALFEREASLWEFWLVQVFSYTDDLQDNLDLLDKFRMRNKERPLEWSDFVDSAGKPITLA